MILSTSYKKQKTNKNLNNTTAILRKKVYI